jgi:hypothetical protein
MSRGPAPAIAKKIVRAINKTWPLPTTYVAGGVDGRVYKTTTPGILIKFVLGSAPEEYTALKKLQNAKIGLQRIVPAFKRGWGHVLDFNRLSNKQLQDLANWWPESYEKSPSGNSGTGNFFNDEITVFLLGQVGDSNSLTAQAYEQRFGSRANLPSIRTFMMRAWEEMRQRNLVHGDLHTGNVIVSFEPNGKIKSMWVIDFGRHVKGNIEKYPSYELYPSWNVFTRHLKNKMESAIPLYNTRGGSRSNINMLRTAWGINIPQNKIQEINKLRQNLNRLKVTVPKAASVRKAKSLSPKKSPTKSPRARSANARVSLNSKAPSPRSISLKRKRASSANSR